MADISGGTPEAVALELLSRIAECEGKAFGPPGTAFNQGFTAADRAWVLDTYAECLQAARALRSLPKTTR